MLFTLGAGGQMACPLLVQTVEQLEYIRVVEPTWGRHTVRNRRCSFL